MQIILQILHEIVAGEMLVGPAGALFMDEISTGLDSRQRFRL